MAFHEVRFPADLSFGSVGGPERRTEVVTLANGHEERNTPWAHARRRYDAGLGMRSLDDIAALIARYGAEHPEHPMTEVLREGQASAERPRRRGGWRRQQRD